MIYAAFCRLMSRIYLTVIILHISHLFRNKTGVNSTKSGVNRKNALHHVAYRSPFYDGITQKAPLAMRGAF